MRGQSPFKSAYEDALKKDLLSEDEINFNKLIIFCEK